MLKQVFTFLLMAIALGACGNARANAESADDKATENDKLKSQQNMTVTNPADTNSVRVEVKTTAGDFTVLLYGDTPAHRDNFVKLVREGVYNNTLFHRVINEFMVQAGDPDSRTAKPGQMLGSGDMGYTLEAEILFPKHFHKRGALAAARQGDQVNPERRSSGSQFYVVTGRKVSEGEVSQLDRMLANSQMQSVFNALAAQNMDSIRAMQARGDRQGLSDLQNKLIAETEKQVAEHPLKVTDEMRQAYTTVGGAPHLDNQYTVFGEVISGMETIDKIEKAETDSHDRPKEDIRIISMKILGE